MMSNLLFENETLTWGQNSKSWLKLMCPFSVQKFVCGWGYEFWILNTFVNWIWRINGGCRLYCVGQEGTSILALKLYLSYCRRFHMVGNFLLTLWVIVCLRAFGRKYCYRIGIYDYTCVSTFTPHWQEFRNEMKREENGKNFLILLFFLSSMTNFQITP